MPNQSTDHFSTISFQLQLAISISEKASKEIRTAKLCHLQPGETPPSSPLKVLSLKHKARILTANGSQSQIMNDFPFSRW